MSYIYAITNNINGKQYVGKTNFSLQKRFQEHIRDSKQRIKEHRPLYNAFNKYGIENFSIKVLEECPWEEASNKEIYWIGKLDTYENGYNATLGGDSKVLYDYKTIADKYQELQNQKETADFFNCDAYTVRTACKEYNIDILSGAQISKEKNGKKIQMFSKDNIFIQEFSDMSDAARWLIENNITTAQIKNISCNIGRVANGKRKSAYSYIWKFSEIEG